MNVFITGATGYIGFNIALAYRRAGHAVWGLTRSSEKAQMLSRHEIRPVVGSLQKPEGWAEAAKNCSVMIHAAVDYQTDPFALDKQTVEFLLSLANQGHRPKTMIYTSGVWVYGSTGNVAADETTPLNPPKLVARRPSTEEMVLKAGGLRGLVIRPGCVYGYQGGLTGSWFTAAVKEKALTAVGDGNNRWTMVHADDLAEAYLRAGESGLCGEVFNITDRSRWSVGRHAGRSCSGDRLCRQDHVDASVRSRQDHGRFCSSVWLWTSTWTAARPCAFWAGSPDTEGLWMALKPTICPGRRLSKCSDQKKIQMGSASPESRRDFTAQAMQGPQSPDQIDGMNPDDVPIPEQLR